MDNKIGYIINESGIMTGEFNTFDSSSASIKKMDMKFHNENRVIGYGVLQTADEKNRNRRIYRREDLAREINAPRQLELLSAGQLCGESGHPIGADAQTLVRQQTIDPKNTCVRFLKLWMEGNNVMAFFEGTNNEAGETFDKDLRMGIKPAFSLRALGTIKATPSGAYVENLKMITYDYVIYPSHKGAYTLGVVNESASNIFESGFSLTEGTDATKSYIKEFTNNDVVKALQDQSSMKESAISFIKDRSLNFKMLCELYDMTKFDTIDIINSKKIALTEAGNATIVMNIEDYIAKELQNYKG